MRQEAAVINTHILYVEDNPTVRELYTDLLSLQGFSVQACADCASALEKATENLPDLALLDISLQDGRDAGFQLCADLRRMSRKLPILFLTSHETEREKISGIRLGADDYITKDASLDYLVIRIEALLRRCAELTGPTDCDAGKNGKQVVTVGPLNVDVAHLQVSWYNQVVPLSLGQMRMVQALAEHHGQVASFSALMRKAGTVVEPNTVTAHVRAIRKAFQAIDPGFTHIASERGVGYRWTGPANG